MTRQLFLALGITFLPAVAMAAPNFAGSWVRDNAKSDQVPNQTYWLTRSANNGGGRGGGGGGNNAPAPVVMTVKQDANALEVTDPQGVIRKYTLDGKPLTRTTETLMQKATVTAAIQGDTVVIGTTQPFGGMPGNATLEIKEVWALSPDGKTLTVTTTRTLPAQKTTYKQVFTR